MSRSTDREDARRRVAELESDPEVKRWITRLRKLMKEQPKSVWLFAEGGHLNVMARHGRDDKYDNEHGGYMQDSTVEAIRVEMLDGGGW